MQVKCSRCLELECICGDVAFEAWVDEQELLRTDEGSSSVLFDPFVDEIPCWHADSDRLNEIPELATIRQMEQR